MQLHDKNKQEENRLIILFLFYKMGMPLKSDMAEEYLVEKEWINYFDLKNQIISLEEEGYLEKIDQLIRITAKGIFILDNFKKEIPFSIREEIINYAQDNKTHVRKDMEIYANFSQDSSNDFPVVLKLFDNNEEALTLRVVATTREEAEKICYEFKENANQIYAELIIKITEKI